MDLNPFKSGPNPSIEANKTLAKNVPEQERYYNDYINRGKNAGQDIGALWHNQITSPEEDFNNKINTYSQSPYFKKKLAEKLNAERNTAAAGGFVGTGFDVQNEGDIASLMQEEDMQKYLDRLYDIQNKAAQGSKDIYGTGFNATSDLAKEAAATNANEAQLTFKGQEEQNQRHADTIKALTEAAATIGAGVAAGPEGIALAAAIKKYLATHGGTPAPVTNATPTYTR